MVRAVTLWPVGLQPPFFCGACSPVAVPGAPGAELAPAENPVDTVFRTRTSVPNGLLGIRRSGTDKTLWAFGNAVPQFDANGNLLNATSFQVLPAPAQMLLIVMYQWPVIGGPLGLNFGNLGNGTYLLISTHVFMVEPPT